MKILLVDDSKSARYALRLQLQRHGIDVETADSAEAALQWIKSNSADAVFMDHTMPGMNGFEALDILKADAETADIPVIMCTSNEDPEYSDQAQRKGAFGILPKSVAATKLPAVLTRLKREIADLAPRPDRAPAPPPPPPPVTITGDSSKEAIEREVRAQITPLLGDMVDRVTEKVLAANEDRVAMRIAEEVKRLHAGLVQSIDERSRLDETRLETEVVPRLVGKHLTSNSEDLVPIIERVIEAQKVVCFDDPTSMRQVIDVAEEMATARASEVAKRQAEEAAAGAAASQVAELSESLRTGGGGVSSGTVYGLFVVATLLGAGAAGAVYYLLGGLG